MTEKIVLDPKVRELRAVIAARQLVAEGARMESIGSLESSPSLEFNDEQADAVMSRVMEIVQALPQREKPNPEAFARALNLLSHQAGGALKKLTDNNLQAAATLSLDERSSLEAIIIADGSRPSFLLDNGEPPLKHPFMGTWEGMVAVNEKAISRIAKAVGRIQPSNGHNGFYIGTGSLVDRDKGLILTNFHVLDDAPEFGVKWEDAGGGMLRFLDQLEIDFRGEAFSFDTNRFRIVEARRHSTSGRGFGTLDAVTMKIEAKDGNSILPENAVCFSRNAETFMQSSGTSLCTIGFPGPPAVDNSLPIRLSPTRTIC